MSITKNSNLTPTVCRIFFVALSDVATITSLSDGFHFQVDLSAGTSWTEIYFTPGSAELSEKSKDHEAGTMYEQSLRFTFPGDDPANLASLDQVMDRPVLVKIQLSSSQYHLMGRKENGARLSRSLQVSSKNAGSQLEFTCFSAAPIGWLSV